MFKILIHVCLLCLLPQLLRSKGNKDLPTTTSAAALLQSQPVRFLENAGQMLDQAQTPIPFVLFRASVPGLDLYVTETGLTYVFNKQTKVSKPVKQDAPDEPELPSYEVKWERVDMTLKGATINKRNIKKEFPEQGFNNYFLAHCPDGIKNVKQYGKLTIKNIYPGIDWVLYNSGKTGFKYDFIVHPGADASKIQLLYSSIQPLKMADDGSLIIKNNSGTLTENAPYTYLKKSFQKVESSFEIVTEVKKEDHIETLMGFNIKINQGPTGEALVIDPQLIWATLLGGSVSEMIRSVDHDRYDNTFMTGHSQSSDFPVKNAGTYFQGTVTTVYNSSAFISKFNAAGVLMWSTYYGGTAGEGGYSIAVDSLANIFVTGITYSSNLPVQNSGAFFQGTYGGGTADAFILKFDNIGNRLWATYYGGSGHEFPLSICTDKHGNVFTTGITASSDFPLQNAGTFYNSTFNTGSRAYIIKLDNTCHRLWATYFSCDRINAITTDGKGNMYVTGYAHMSTPIQTLNPGGGAYFKASIGSFVDAFIAKFDNPGNLLWSTYYGGTKEDYGKSVIADKSGNVFIAGITRSKDLPVVGDGSYLDSISSNSPTEDDAFIAKFGAAGALLWATYCGGPGHDEMITLDNLAIDACNGVYYSFESNAAASTFSACEGGYLDTVSNGHIDQYIMRFSNTGVLQWASYLGSGGNETGSALDINNAGELFMAGRSSYTSGATTYTFVNPGGGAHYQNPSSTLVGGMGAIARFGGRMATAPPNFSYKTICLGIDSESSPVLTNSFVSGGLFSTTHGPPINQFTGKLSLSSLVPGTYTVFYHYEACQCYTSEFVLNLMDCTGLSDLSIKNGLRILGNPNTGSFSVEGDSKAELILFNELGQMIRKDKLSAMNEYRLTITGLEPGIYFLSDVSSSSAHKIIVLR